MGLREDIEKTKHDISIFNFYANPVPKPPLLDYQSRVMDAAEKWAAVEYGADEHTYGMTLDKYTQIMFQYADGVRNIIFDLETKYRASQEAQ